MASISDFDLAYQISPITMTGGIAQDMPGGAIPALSFLNALSFGLGILEAATSASSVDDTFARFLPLPGSTLIAQKIGLYPFANQYVAANAVVFDPKTISMLMICPARLQGDAFARAAIMTAFQQSLEQHNEQGGLYSVATPVFTYDNLVMLNMTDVSSRESKQMQTAYQLDFIQPLVTLQQAQGAQNSLMSAIGAGTPTNGATSGLAGTVGAPGSLAAGSVVPAASPSSLGLPVASNGVVPGGV